MSPEQVRGLPVDRRSDVFSCGIVLYELLTGERLFVGESDFSTLEKVRNVEILPPSTYNRKIQPELERIVLKALAKDVEDRYQNAIDLHDELQAFVYTSGEFYSRKDLASWMKQLWSKEIQRRERKARLVSRHGAAGTGSQRHHHNQHRPRWTGANPFSQRPQDQPSTDSREWSAEHQAWQVHHAHAPWRQCQALGQRHFGLEWDEDELETSIYDEESPLEEADIISPATYPTPAMAPAAMAAATMTGAPTAPALTGSALSSPGGGGGGDTNVTPMKEEPNLSSLVATAQGWEAPHPTPDLGTSDFDMTGGPDRVADGSNRTKAPADPVGPGGVSEVLRMASLAAPGAMLEPNEFGAALVPTSSSRRTNLLYGLIAISILIAGGIVAIVLASTGGKGDTTEVASGEPGMIDDTEAKTADGPGDLLEAPTVASPTVTGIASANTGLDLIVNPAGVKVSLDGRSIGKAPLQIRSLRPGEHFIEIEAPPGFFSKSETVTVTQDSADRVEIKLVAMDITGTFESQPPGAEVILIADGVSQSLGTAPAEARIDPRKHYEVLFKKDGFATVTKPVEITGSAAFSVVGALSKSRASVKPSPEDTVARTKPLNPVEPKVVVAPKPIVEDKPETKPDPEPRPAVVANDATGTLLLSAKPPCNIFIDGRDTGKMTPQRDIQLPVGKHRITLLNNALGIKESFNVKITADKATKALKDYTDQID